MVIETRKQSMAWMEHVLQTSLKMSALSMEDKMAAGASGVARNFGWDSPPVNASFVKGSRGQKTMKFFVHKIENIKPRWANKTASLGDIE